jgi:hypothetical protein
VLAHKLPPSDDFPMELIGFDSVYRINIHC